MSELTASSAVAAPTPRPKNSATRFILAGNVPLLAVAIVSGAAFFIGRSSVVPHDKVAVVEQGAIVLEAVLARPGVAPDVIEAEVRQPILKVLRKYADGGYTVVDVSKDERGNMAVAALPVDATDITDEMRQAVHLAPAASAAAPAAPSLNKAAASQPRDASNE